MRPFSITLTLFLFIIFSANSQRLTRFESKIEPNKNVITFSKKLENTMAGEGFRLIPNKKLRHAFYSDISHSAYTKVGSWTISKDSVFFNIQNRILTTKYDYNATEKFSTVMLKYSINDDKNSYLISVVITILNNGNLGSNYISEMNAIIDNYLEVQSENTWLIDKQVEEINNNLAVYLAKNNLFSSFNTNRKNYH